MGMTAICWTCYPGTWVVFRPSTPINVQSKIKWQSNFALGDAYVNEQQISISGGQEVFEIDFTGELTNLCLRGAVGQFAGTLLYLEIDGNRLIDGVGITYGEHGFHLDFSDPNDIGKDTSLHLPLYAEEAVCFHNAQRELIVVD